MLAAYDFLVLQRKYVNDRDYDTIDNNVFEDLYDYFTYSRGRYLVPAACVSYGAHLLASCTSRSTYVCTSTGSHTIPGFQILGTILDAILITAIAALLRETRDSSRRLQILANIALAAAFILSIGAPIGFLFRQHDSATPPLSSAYLWDATFDGLTCAAVLASVNYVMTDFRPLSLTIVAIFVLLYTELVSSSWPSRAAYPPYSTSAKTIGFLFLGIGSITATHMYKMSEPRDNFARRIPLGVHVFLSMLFVAVDIIFMSRSKYVGFYPPDYSMYNARIHSDRWLTYASTSKSLRVAVGEYQTRYSRLPPPNFDKWFAFAQERNVLIIDTYDRIEEDLLPFWALEPSTVRERTLIQKHSCNIVGISIRNGHAEAGPTCTPEDSWVGKETVAMINSFAQWLPDMNIAINTKITPQVAVPWEVLEQLKQEGRDSKSSTFAHLNHNFTSAVEPAWAPLDFEIPGSSSVGTSSMKLSPKSKSVFEDLLIPSCPPKSKIKKFRHWNMRDICARCVRPHSLGAFIQNRTLSADVCHQPDMAALHSFYMQRSLSPNGESDRNTILPLFSRSTAHGYNDIVFPGPADFVEPVSDLPGDKPFLEKQSSMFWRGTAENSAGGNSWHGNQQQRLVHWVTNYTGGIPMLIEYKNKLAYESVPARSLASISMDVGFIDITQCTKYYCEEQSQEFTTVSEANIDEYWDHKYLIDIDSTKPSGNLLSFIQSNSLPFRASIFRYWFDDRLVPWLHYIPVDMRLHGLYASLTYFTGVKANIGGRDIVMDDKEYQADFIAGQGKRWAEKAVRKEDAEVYFFRLLLEWGRIVDDNRDVIGFSL